MPPVIKRRREGITESAKVRFNVRFTPEQMAFVRAAAKRAGAANAGTWCRETLLKASGWQKKASARAEAEAEAREVPWIVRE